MVLLPMLWAIILGIIGGVANSLLLEDGFALPFVVVKEHKVEGCGTPGFCPMFCLAR